MRLPPFDIEHLFARYEFSAAFNLTGSDVEPLSLAELLALADAESRSLWDDLGLGYTESPGLPRLREQVASTAATIGPDDVHIFAGATEAVFVAANVLVGHGDHAVVIGPTYQLLTGAPLAAGAEVTEVRLRAEDRWELDLDRVRAAVRPNTRLIVANFPNNPTGALPDRATFEALVRLAERAGARLLSDEIYRGLERDPSRMLPCGVDLGPHVLSLSGMSKVYGLAGLRIGWIATRDPEVMAALRNFRYWTTLCTSAPSEVLALIALRSASQLLDRARRLVTANVAAARELAQTFDGLIDLVLPVGGTTAFPRLRAEAADPFCERLIEDHGVLLAPASVFHAPGEHFRLGLGRSILPEGLGRVARALAEAA